MTAIPLAAVQLRDYPMPEGNGRTLYGMCTEAGPKTKLWRDELGWVHIQLDGQPRVVAVPPDMVRRVDYTRVSPAEAAAASGFLSPETAETFLASVEQPRSPAVAPAALPPMAETEERRAEVERAKPVVDDRAPPAGVALVTDPSTGRSSYADVESLSDVAADALAAKPLTTASPTVCPHCSKPCADPRGLAAHVRAKHGGAK